MNVNVEWLDDNKTVILQTFQSGWTWKDFSQSNGVIIPEMMSTVSHKVSIISNYLEASNIPMNGGAISNARKAMSKYPDNWKMLVVVSDKRFITMLVDMFRRISPGNLGSNTYSAASIDEALMLIKQKATA